MNQEQVLAFLDELDSIHSDLEKTAFQPGYAQGAAQRGFDATARGAEQVGRGAASFLTPKKSFKRGWQETFHPGGKPLHWGYKAMMGAGLLQGARDVSKKVDPTGRGHSRPRRLLRVAGEQAGGILGAPFGIPGGIAASMLGSKLGDTVGSGLERAVRYRPQAHLPPPPVGAR